MTEVMCKLCMSDVYAVPASAGAPEKDQDATTHDLLHTHLPIVPSDRALWLSDKCIADADISTKETLPTYSAALGVLLPDRSKDAEHAPLHALESAAAAYMLPAIPTRLVDRSSPVSQSPIEAEILGKLQRRFDTALHDIAAFVRETQHSLQSAIQDATDHVQVAAHTTPKPAAAPSESVRGLDVPADAFAKRPSTEAPARQVSAGALSQSFSRLGRGLPERPPRADDRHAAPRAAADAPAAPAPKADAPAPNATRPAPAPAEGLSSARHVAFANDDDMGAIEEEVNRLESDDPVFEIDEELGLEAANAPVQPAEPRPDDAEAEERAAPDTEASYKLNTGLAMSFSGVDTSNPIYAEHPAPPSYEHEQQGPYDMVEDKQLSGSLAARRAVRAEPERRTSRPQDRYADEDLALAGVLAANTPSHRNLQHSQQPPKLWTAEGEQRWGAWQSRVHQLDAGTADLAASMPAKKFPPGIPMRAPRREISDGLDREPKTSLPYKEKMMVPSLRQAVRGFKRSPGPTSRVPSSGMLASSQRTTGFAAGDAPKPSDAPMRRTASTRSARRGGANAVPPVPYVPSASLRVSLGPESEPRALEAIFGGAGTDDFSKLLYYMHFLQNLKLSKRTGWYHHGIPAPESIADHMYRMAMLAMLVRPDGLDIPKCVMMALVHDLAEAQVGDLTPMCHVDKAEKQRRETEAIHYLTQDLLGNSPAAANILQLWHEYEERTTAEARLVKDLDCFELCLQTYEYELAHGTRDLQQFWIGAASKIAHPQVKSWTQALLRKRRALWEGRGLAYDAPSA